MSTAPATSSPKKEAPMTTETPDFSKMTQAGRLRWEVAQHLDAHHAALRDRSLKLAIEIGGDDDAIVARAERFLTFLSADAR